MGRDVHLSKEGRTEKISKFKVELSLKSWGERFHPGGVGSTKDRVMR